MCFTADHKSCVNQVHYIYVHRYIFMSLCSTWPRFMYVKPLVVASILDYFDVSLHRFTVACEKTVSLHSVSIPPPPHSLPLPFCPFKPFVVPDNSKPKTKERERGRSYEPRKEVNAKVLILLGTNTAWNGMAWSPYRPHNVLHKSFPVFYAITY